MNAPVKDDVDRGLQFLAYQTSIDDQFEFVTKSWVNNPDFKENAGLGGGGIDPILGQTANGHREFDLTFPVDSSNAPTKPRVRLSTNVSWVTATGGGYFFSPSIDALTNHLV